jgi:hypothetical protein
MFVDAKDPSVSIPQTKQLKERNELPNQIEVEAEPFIKAQTNNKRVCDISHENDLAEPMLKASN